MRHTVFAITLVVSMMLGLPQRGAAQTTAPPTIHNVTLHESAGVLTITGTGFGPEPRVTIAGQPVTVLSGGTETQIDVLAPAPLLTTPGSYRLTLVDPVRQGGDAFVVASQAGTVALGGVAAATAVSGSLTEPSVIRTVVAGVEWSSDSPARQVIEDSSAPFRTAIGFEALLNNTGVYNTASGYQALRCCNAGGYNTATGAKVLHNNTGSSNTATGFEAMHWNTNGSSNTATGYQALKGNVSGGANTATGAGALAAQQLGGGNTATGVLAMNGSDMAFYNTATGYGALLSGKYTSHNTAIGVQALENVRDGTHNVALGSGAGRGSFNGSYNVFIGASVGGTAADTNTIRIGLPYSGGVGQNKTFIAGIHGTELTGSAVQVFIDTNGQLGTVVPGVQSGTIEVPISQLEQQVRDEQVRELQATVADLRARLARLEALLAPSAKGN